MLPYDGKINEHNTVYQEFQNLTILDLIKVFNERKQDGSFSQHENDTNKLLDIIAHHFDYYDRYDMLSSNQYSTSPVHSINHVYEVLDVLAKMYGYYSHIDFIQHNKERLKDDEKLFLNDPVDINNDNETLLRIDMRGNVWLKGNIENNPTKIGREILNVAQQYRDNFRIETAADYLNTTLKEIKKEEYDDLPF